MIIVSQTILAATAAILLPSAVSAVPLLSFCKDNQCGTCPVAPGHTVGYPLCNVSISEPVFGDFGFGVVAGVLVSRSFSDPSRIELTSSGATKSGLMCLSLMMVVLSSSDLPQAPTRRIVVFLSGPSRPAHVQVSPSRR